MHFSDSMVFFLRVFASAQTLFYYAKHARPTNKQLSREEIEALLAQSRACADIPQPEEEGERQLSTEGEGAGNEVTPTSGLGRDTNREGDELHIERSGRHLGAVPIPILSDVQALEETKSAEEWKPSALAGDKNLPSAPSAGADIEISDLEEGMNLYSSVTNVAQEHVWTTVDSIPLGQTVSTD